MDQSCIHVLCEPVGSILKGIHVTRRSEYDVYKVIEKHARKKPFHPDVVTFFIQRNSHHPAAHPVVYEQFLVIIFREAICAFGKLVDIKDRASHGIPSAFTHQWKFPGSRIRDRKSTRLNSSH